MPLVFNQEWPKSSRQMLREFYPKSRELCGDVFCPIIHPANIREAAGAGPRHSHPQRGSCLERPSNLGVDGAGEGRGAWQGVGNERALLLPGDKTCDMGTDTKMCKCW